MAKKKSAAASVSLPTCNTGDTAVESAKVTGGVVTLARLSIRNFMAISEEVEIVFDAFTVLVGRNDVGKSGILKALDALIGAGTVTSDNVCRFSKDSIIEIIGAFSPCDIEIDIDEGNKTDFASEGLLDEHGYVRLRKTWDFSSGKLKHEVYVLGETYPELGALVTRTQTELIADCKKNNIETKQAGVGEYNNAEKRRKLRQALASAGVASERNWIQLATTGTTRRKTVYDGVVAVLPQFKYFRADTSLEESDSAIQSYLKSEVTAAIGECNLTDIEDTIRKRLEGVLQNLTTKINRTVSKEESVSPHIEFDWGKLVKTTFRTKNEEFDIPLSHRGDGFRRITMMAFFEHLAETRLPTGCSNLLFGFEEPETFLHPSAQEQLFETLSLLPEAGYQVLVCTHSPTLVAKAPYNSLAHVVREDRVLKVEQAGLTYRKIADDLGITMRNQFFTSFDTARVLFLVEGIDDANSINHAIDTYKKAGLIQSSFGDLGIVVFPAGGCSSIAHWVALDLLKSLSKPYCILHDSDMDGPQSKSETRDSLVDLGFQEHVHFKVTRKREIENYIPSSFLNRRVPGAGLNYTAFCDVKKKCKDVATEPAKTQLGGKYVCRHHFPHMSFVELQEGFRCDDGTDELLEWYEWAKAKVPATP